MERERLLRVHPPTFLVVKKWKHYPFCWVLKPCLIKALYLDRWQTFGLQTYSWSKRLSPVPQGLEDWPVRRQTHALGFQNQYAQMSRFMGLWHQREAACSPVLPAPHAMSSQMEMSTCSAPPASSSDLLQALRVYLEAIPMDKDTEMYTAGASTHTHSFRVGSSTGRSPLCSCSKMGWEMGWRGGAGWESACHASMRTCVQSPQNLCLKKNLRAEHDGTNLQSLCGVDEDRWMSMAW